MICIFILFISQKTILWNCTSVFHKQENTLYFGTSATYYHQYQDFKKTMQETLTAYSQLQETGAIPKKEPHDPGGSPLFPDFILVKLRLYSCHSKNDDFSLVNLRFYFWGHFFPQCGPYTPLHNCFVDKYSGIFRYYSLCFHRFIRAVHYILSGC